MAVNYTAYKPIRYTFSKQTISEIISLDPISILI